jgi:hypothetical protein
MLGWILYYALPNFSDVVLFIVAKTLVNRFGG